MTTSAGSAPPEGWARPAVAVAGLVGVLVLGLALAALVADREAERASDRDAMAATRAADEIGAALDRSISTLRGINGLAADGEVSEAEFRIYADEALPGSLFPAIALAVLVDGDERSSWERQWRTAIADQVTPAVGETGLVPAPPRARYAPVLWVEPEDAVTRPVVGFDLLGDPQRAGAAAIAAQRGEPVVSDPVRLATTGELAVFVVQPLVDGRDDEHLGFASSGIGVDALVAAAAADLPPGTAVELRSEGRSLAGDVPDGTGATRGLRVGARDWVVAVDDPREAAWWPPVAIVAATLASAVLVALAIHRERGFERLRRERREAEHHIVVTLQERLLPPLATVDGLRPAAHYEPATRAVGIGGDWYDLIERADGSVVLVLGDVLGHGVDAVATMAQVRYLVAGLVRTGVPLGEIFARVQDMLPVDHGMYATAQLLHIDPVRRCIGTLNAGHPPALLRTPDGGVVRLEHTRQPPLGVPLERTSLTYRELLPGSAVLAYSDGLVERRHESIDESIDRLAARLAHLDPEADPGTSLSAIVGDLRTTPGTGRPVNDDVAAVLVAVDAPLGAAGRG